MGKQETKPLPKKQQAATKVTKLDLGNRKDPKMKKRGVKKVTSNKDDLPQKAKAVEAATDAAPKDVDPSIPTMVVGKDKGVWELATQCLLEDVMLPLKEQQFSYSGTGTNENRKELQIMMKKKYSKEYNFVFPATTNEKRNFTNSIKKLIIPDFMKSFVPGMFASMTIFLTINNHNHLQEYVLNSCARKISKLRRA